MDPIISLDSLSKHFKVPVRKSGLKASIESLFKREYRTVKAVEGISFQIEPGEVVGFLGPNGAGKTTTLGMALGLVHPKLVKRNADARTGDRIILGKPLGVGILSAALKKDAVDAENYAKMIAVTTQLNTPGPELAALPGVHAMTDVTGFGLAGHLLEICRGLGVIDDTAAGKETTIPNEIQNTRRNGNGT